MTPDLSMFNWMIVLQYLTPLKKYDSGFNYKSLDDYVPVTKSLKKE